MRKVWRGSWFNRGADHGLIEETGLFLDHKVVEHIAFNSL